MGFNAGSSKGRGPSAPLPAEPGSVATANPVSRARVRSRTPRGKAQGRSLGLGHAGRARWYRGGSIVTDSPDIPTTLTIREWQDALLAERGVRADSNYTTLVWGGLIGPTAVVLLRLLGQLTTDSRVVAITVQELAATIGVSPPLALRGIDRLARFGFIQRRGNTLSVRHFVDLVTEGRVHKLSPLAQRVDGTFRQRVISPRTATY
jgi:hypothetical protein